MYQAVMKSWEVLMEQRKIDEAFDRICVEHDIELPELEECDEIEQIEELQW